MNDEGEITMTITYKAFHFAEPKTVEEALNWLKETHVNFDRLSGYVETDCMPVYCRKPVEALNFVNGINFKGNKIRKNSTTDFERRRFANAKIEYFVIDTTWYDNGHGETLYNFYGYRSYDKFLARNKSVFDDGTATITLSEI